MLAGFFVLFGIVFAWLVFAAVQDLKTREIANWLSFSLIALALAFRALVSIGAGQWSAWVWGIAGFAVWIGLAYALYYGRVFAGGDAKLLMGVGIALPYSNGVEIMLLGGAFFVLLFFIGALYTLAYSVPLVVRKQKAFWSAFQNMLHRRVTLVMLGLAVAALLIFAVLLGDVPEGITGTQQLSVLLWSSMVLMFGIPFLYAYVKAVEQACMIHAVGASALREGDWLVGSVRVRGEMIQESVHGLSLEEIEMLKKTRKVVKIREGVPFTPAFVLAYALMGYAVFAGWFPA